MVGRMVAGIDGTGFTVRSPAKSGQVVADTEGRWGRKLTVRWQDGSEEGFMARSFFDMEANGGIGWDAGQIGVYLLPVEV